ncbi:MAG TPA: murein biosynthesis integral membrane protein MurJ [Candidatus Bathyarchaeia archaeon]|nr:murein biosynthesis integral membrane protein MurJ [Candidatus Bathyarchaeia archaeon]
MSDTQRALHHGVVRAVGAIGAATLVSRVLGFARDMVVARAFGAGPVTDAFFVAFRIPNLLRRLLAEGALSTAIVPVFTEYLHRGGREEFVRLVRAVTGVGTVVLCVVSGLGMLLAPWIVRVMAPGWTADPSLVSLAGSLTRVMFPYLVLVGLAALAMGALNAQHRFFSAALGPAVVNVAMIVCVLVLAGHMATPIFSLAVGVLVGGAGQLLVQLPELARLGVPLRPSGEWTHPGVRTIGVRLWPAVFALAAVQVTVLVNTLLASLLPQGTVSYLYYADRVMEFPLGVFGIALATAVLPGMAAQAARGEQRALTDTLGFAVRLSAFVAVPAAVGLVVLGLPIVRLLFQRGEFGHADAVATAQALTGYAVGLPAFSATRIAAQTFYALGDTRTPVWAGYASVAVNVALAVVLMWPLKHAGLALASSLSAYVNVLLLYWLLRKRLGRLGSRETLRSLARTAAGSAALALWCVAVAGRLGTGWRGMMWTSGAVVVAVAVYVGVAALLRAPELGALYGMLRPPRQSLPGAGSG